MTSYFILIKHSNSISILLHLNGCLNVSLWWPVFDHYSDLIMSTMASQITGISIVYSTICSGADQRKHQSSASLACVRGIQQWHVNSRHKGPVMWKMFPFDDIIMDDEIHEMPHHIIGSLSGEVQHMYSPHRGSVMWNFISSVPVNMP